MENTKILVVDDDWEVRESIERTLNRNGFNNTTLAGDAQEAIEMIDKTEPDLIILDVKLPEIDGLELLRRIRNMKIDVPVIMLTCLEDDDHKVQGFEYGADDYIVKPFKSKEFILRIKAILRRAYPENDEMVKLNNVTVNLATAEVYYDDERDQTHLTAMEFLLFSKLYENLNKIVSIPSLTESAYNCDSGSFKNTLITHIRRLREKIEVDPGNPVNLVTVRGLGYRLVKPGK